MKKAHGFGLYGLWGPITDPGERDFSAHVRDRLGVEVHDSPYRDYQTNDIANIIQHLPGDVTILLWGSSLGANNLPVIASAVPQHIIHGMFGFQASAAPGAARCPIPPNVQFAHLLTNPYITLGSLRWVKEGGNKTTRLYITENSDWHPGDLHQHDQDMFLTEMRWIMERA